LKSNQAFALKWASGWSWAGFDSQVSIIANSTGYLVTFQEGVKNSKLVYYKWLYHTSFMLPEDPRKIED
jgi:hypothetical protein